MVKNIFIVGLGLIGTSLALGMKKEHPNIKITGLDIQSKSQEFALNRGIIDEVGESIEKAAGRADVIFLCCPVEVVKKQLKILSEIPLKKSVIITDVASTKSEIVQEAERLHLKGFIGGHPMAGSHKSGVTAGEPLLFENAYYILIPSEGVEWKDVQSLQNVLSGTRAKFLILSPREHDEITGMLSHLPHIIAAGLVNQSKIFNENHPRSKQLAAGGFRDITRIASSDPQMWTDILLSNRDILMERIDLWQIQMNQVCQWLDSENRQAIFEFFSDAKEIREQMPVHKEGSIPRFHDLFVNIPDIPGVIGEVTNIIGKQNLSLINVRILETREDIFGILQLSFKNRKDLVEAKKAIEDESNYSSYEQ